MDLNSLTIDRARSAVQERKMTALALTEAHYVRRFRKKTARSVRF